MFVSKKFYKSPLTKNAFGVAMGGLLLKLQNFKKVKLIFGHPVCNVKSQAIAIQYKIVSGSMQRGSTFIIFFLWISKRSYLVYVIYLLMIRRYQQMEIMCLDNLPIKKLLFIQHETRYIMPVLTIMDLKDERTFCIVLIIFYNIRHESRCRRDWIWRRLPYIKV